MAGTNQRVRRVHSSSYRKLRKERGMAIDAVIERVIRRDWVGDGSLRLRLAPRVDAEGQDTCSGRSVLNLLGARTVEPQVGMVVWGGADIVYIGSREYDRKGSFLREAQGCPRCYAAMRWAEITNEETGERREVMRCQRCGAEERL